MSDEQERPLTRRELRMREGWANTDTESIPEIPAESSVAADSISSALAADPAPPTTSSIPVIGPDGQIMSRRQLRELWAAEEAAAQAEAQAKAAEAEKQASEEPILEQDIGEQLDVAAEVANGIESETSEFSAVATVPAVETEVDEDTQESETEKRSGRLRFPWSRSQRTEKLEVESTQGDVNLTPIGDESEAPVEAFQEEENSEEPLDAEVIQDASDTILDSDDPASDISAEETSQTDQLSNQDATPELEPEPEPVAEPEPEPYSFPEVSPEPESRSIFDVPDERKSDAGGSRDADDSGAFDDIITRAVADEGAAAPTNTSALILPTLPETSSLAGALNETGEIIITGSIELPRSLGETGGHITIHDTLDPREAAVLGHDFHEIAYAPDSDSKPISAKSAVSAQELSTPLVGPANTGPSKLPLILGITAGGLLVIVTGVFVWAASTGLFG